MAKRICSVPQCEKPHCARGFCNTHYAAARSKGLPALPKVKGCTVAECNEPHRGRGYCEYHYRRWYHHGDPLWQPPWLNRTEKQCSRCGELKPVSAFWRRHDRTNGVNPYCIACLSKPPQICGCGHMYHGRGGQAPEFCEDCAPSCAVLDCDLKIAARGWCKLHHYSWLTYGDPLTALRKTDNSGPCLVDWCDRKAQAFGYCTAHREQIRKNGSVSPRPQCDKCGVDIYAGQFPRRSHAKRCGLCKRKNARRRLPVKATDLLTEGLPLCGICGCDVDLNEHGQRRMGPHVDHIVPRSLGGLDDILNLQLAHRDCNLRKRAKTGFSLVPTT